MRCVTNKISFKQWYILLGLTLSFVFNIQAEGVQQLAPTAADSPIMLESGRPDFANFAAYDGPENGRLNISIGDANEVVYLGLSVEYSDRGNPYSNAVSAQYRFRIKRVNPAGTDPVVHGPFLISTNNANLDEWADASFGNYDVTAVDNDGNLIFEFNPTVAGEYYIEFDDIASSDSNDNLPEYRKVNIGLWDITVTNNGIPIDGRVWSQNWALRTPEVTGNVVPDCEWDRQFRGTFYSYTTDGFVSKIDFADAGMQGLTFLVAFNSKGPGISGDLALDRMSVPNVNATANASEHKIFLAPPDITLFPDGLCGTITPASAFECNGDNTYCIDVTVSKPGQVELIIDFNQNGILDPVSQDVSIVYEFLDGSLTACVPWNGLRGDGSSIGLTDTVDLIFNYAQGIQHWSAYDVEFMRNGYCIETVRPICDGVVTANQLYWDDRNVTDEPGTGALKDGRNGCDCATGCRSWDNFNINSPDGDCNNVTDANTTGYGDKTTLNTWWFATSSSTTRASIPLINIAITGPDDVCEGETVTFTATDQGASGNVTYQWIGPENFMASSASINIGTAGEYCVTITDAGECTSNTCKTLSVIENGSELISYPEIINACIGTVVPINPTGNTIGFSFLWSPVSGEIVDPTLPVQAINFTGNTTYSILITNDITGCSFTETINLTAFADPIPNFTTQVGCEDGLEVNFVNQSTNATSYLWDFGVDGIITDMSTDDSPSYTYPSPGSYQVKLTATSADGCQTMIVQTVTVATVPLIADFDVSYGDCDENSVTVQFTNTTINGADNTTQYIWSFNVPPNTSNLENPSIVVSSSQSITAILTIVTMDGCTDNTSQVFDVNLGAPADQFPASMIICPGESEQIAPGGNPDYTYNWSPTEGIDDPTSAQPTFNPTVTTTYTVTVTSSAVDDCISTETVVVTIPDDINLQVSGGGIFCTASTTLTATTDNINTAIEWYNAANPTVIIGFGPTLTVDVSGDSTYTVVATDNLACVETVTGISVAGGPIDFTTLDTVAVCLGEEIILSITNLDDNDFLSYNWTPAELFVPGTETNPIPDFIEAIGTHEVIVELTNQYGCEAQAAIHIAVVDPTIELGFTSIIDCNGGTVNFTNTSTNAFGYVWDFGDGTSPNFEESPEHTYAVAGTYTVCLNIVYDVNCVEEASCQEITVETPDIFADFTYDIAACSADSATINFYDNSTNSLNNTIGYSWTFSHGDPLTSSAQDTSITVYNNGPLEVSLTILTANDCNNTATETLDIQLVTLDISLTDTIVVCSGSSDVLNPGGDPDLVYSWTPIDGLDDPTATSPMVTPTATMTYFATAYSLVGSDTCFVTDSVVVFVPDDINLQLDQEPVVVTCGEDVSITASTDVDVDIVWTSTLDGIIDETSNTITVNPFQTDTIIATVTDQYGCMATDSIIINDIGVDITVDPSTSLTICNDVEAVLSVFNQDPDDILTYEWSPEEYIVGSTTLDSAVIRIDELGEFIITSIVNNQHGCADTVDITVTVEEFAGLQLDTIVVCANEPTPINPGGDPLLVHNWSPVDEFIDFTDPSNPVVTTNMPLTYYVTITDTEFGCIAMDSIYIDISPEMNLEISPQSTTLCAEGTVTLTANTDIIPANVDWFILPSNDNIGNGVEVTFTPPLGTSEVYAVGTSEAGCTERDTILINNFPINANITDTVIFCNPLATVDLSVTNNDPDQDLMVVWNTDPTVEGPDITVDVIEGQNSFSATVTNQFGCSETLNTMVTIIDLLGNMDISASPDSILLNESSTITVTGCVGCAYEWEPPAENSPIIVVTPTEDGDNIYNVTASLLGCENTLSISVFAFDAMCDVDHVYIPNAFTPNDDGQNDIIRVQSRFLDELLEYELLIYNRWGEEMFHSFDQFESWDGHFRDELLAPDVYGYYLRVLCPMGEELVQKGNITLLR